MPNLLDPESFSALGTYTETLVPGCVYLTLMATEDGHLYVLSNLREAGRVRIVQDYLKQVITGAVPIVDGVTEINTKQH